MAIKLTCGILTYGNRKHLLIPVVERLLTQDDIQVFIFCNGIETSLFDYYKKRFSHRQVSFVYSPNNLGSAGGYHELIKHISNLDATVPLMLLDDDNLVPNDFASKVVPKLGQTSDILYINREDRKILVQARNDKKPCLELGTKNSFLGRDFFAKLFPVFESTPSDLIAAPYSGLILPTGVLKKAILPNKDYFLYADDHEYTYRLVTSHGFNILLVDDITITDLEASFHLDKTHNSFLSNRYLNAEKLRLHYSVRNQFHFGLKRSDSKFIFSANVLGVSFFILLGFLVRGKFKQMVWFLSAIKAGLQFKEVV